MSKQFWAVLIVIAIIMGGIFVITKDNKASAPGTTKGGGLTNHVEGQGSTGVKLVEYGDYECPACGQYEPVVEQVYQKYSSQIYFQFRNFPLYQIHKNAIAAARAAEAADLQGKFWEMHAKLYQQQDPSGQGGWVVSNNPSSYFEQYAGELGLNVAKFKQDYAAGVVNDRIQADLAEGQKLGITGTPSFFLDDKKIDNPQPTLEAFSKVLDAEIAKKAPTAAPSSPQSHQ